MDDAQRARRRIAADLSALGVPEGGTLLVHSSLRSLGPVAGGAETVILGLLDALGAEGTLLLPALSYATVDRANPVFDRAHTPSCVGALSEHFRTRPGTRRSLHPTHSVCGVGPAAERLLDAHPLDDTPCGAHSPFRGLRDEGGRVLMLGCGLAPNTSMHAVEELVEPPYLFAGAVTYRLRDLSGDERAYRCRRHGFVGYAQRYERLEHLLADDELRAGPVLRATAHLVDCRALWRVAEAALRRDPLCFVEPTGPTGC